MIESYEIEKIPRRKPTPAEMLEYLIEYKEVTRAEAARATGTARSAITNVLSGQRQISKENVTQFANYFQVDPTGFRPAG